MNQVIKKLAEMDNKVNFTVKDVVGVAVELGVSKHTAAAHDPDDHCSLW